MKKAIYFFSLLNSLCYSQVDSVIFGLSNKGVPGLYLSRLNPFTGLVTYVSPSPISNGAQIPNATVDMYSKLFYYVNEFNSILGVDLVAGNIVTNALISNVNGVFFDQMIFNASDSTIYGLARNSSPAAVYLSKINPLTGVVTNISSASLSNGENIPNAAINPFAKIYYYINEFDYILGVDLISGNTISAAPVTNSNGTYFDQMEFNASDKTLYGLARKSSPAEVYLAKINPATGVVTNISSTSLSAGESIPNSVLDPCNNVYYYVNEFGLPLGVSCSTGSLVTFSTLSSQFFEMTYNYTCHLNFTFSGIIENKPSVSFNLYPNPTSDKLEFNLKGSASNTTLKLFNSLGQIVWESKNNNSNKFTLDVSNYANGLYYVEAESNQGVSRAKFVKE